MDKRFQKSVEIAYALKEKSFLGHGTHHHTSIIFYKRKILSISENNYTRYSNLLKKFKYTRDCRIHSELGACLKLGLNNAEGLTLINIRIDRNNKLNYAFPCKGCQNLLNYLNFKSVFYSTENGVFEKWEN